MKKRVAQWIGGGLLSAISILIYLCLFQTHLFSNLIFSYVNNSSLIPNRIHVSGELTGSFLGNSIGINHFIMSNDHTRDTLIQANQLRLVEWDWEWDSREMILHELFVDSYSLDLELINDLDSNNLSSNGSISGIVNQFHGNDGKIITLVNNVTETIKLPEFSSTIWMIDGFSHFKIHHGEVIVPAYNKDTLKISGFAEIDTSGQLDINDLTIISNAQELQFDAAVSAGSISSSIQAKDIAPQSLKSLELPASLHAATLDLDLEITLEGKDVSVSGDGLIKLNERVMPFDLHSFSKTEGGLDLDISIGAELQDVNVSLHQNDRGELNGQAELFKTDFSILPEYERIPFTDPIGEITFSGSDGNYQVTPKLVSFMYNGLRFDTLEADLEVSNTNQILIHQGFISQAANKLSISGEITGDSLDILGDLAFKDFNFLHNFGVGDIITGDISSEFNLSGSLKSPRIAGDIHPTALSYKKKLTLSGNGKIDLTVSDGEVSGDFALFGEEGILFGDSLKSYTIQANVSPDHYIIEDVHLQGDDNLVSLSGYYQTDGIQLNKLNILKSSNQLKIADTIRVEHTNDGRFLLPISVLTFNNGGVSLEGEFSNESGLNINSEFELVDVGEILNFFRVNAKFSGLATGNAHLTGSLSDPIIDATFFLDDGMTLGYPSDSANIDIRLTSAATIANSINAFSDGGSLVLLGQLPWGYKVSKESVRTTPQNFSIQTENYKLKDLKFPKIAGFPISGRSTGTLSIRGTPEKTKLDAQLSLSDASFDTLKFSNAYTEFNYEGNLLTFDTLSMVSNWGYGTGQGFMPISMDFIAQDRMAVSHRDMGLEFEFNLNELPFLSSYISAIDVIQGDFMGTFGLSGPLSAPIRNGKIRGHNGLLQISVLGNPITDIHSEVTLVDNTLTFDHFSGKMLFSKSSNLNIQGLIGNLASNVGDLFGVNATQEFAGDISASGTMDMTSFFHPRFDLDVKANEVYYRSTDGLIEAIANADLKFQGQDTLDASAIIPVLRATYYANFESEETYEETVSKTDSSLFTYSLNTQFASDLLISNDQLEAEFEGELWLLDYGDGVMRFSGTLTVQEGGTFYYLGNELNLRSGEIIFNTVDFNPQINMEAEIKIDNEPVTLILSGDLIEPELVINVENAQITQSDVLTYLTLNQKMVEVSFDSESALNPVLTYSEMLVEKQISKFGREVFGLDVVGIDLTADSTAGARVQLGQRVMKNLMVTYEGDVQNIDGQNDYDFGLEYQINSNVSVTSKMNQRGEIELNGRLKFTY